jgi:prephenate dehydratase
MSKSAIHTARIAFQGGIGSYSHQAASLFAKSLGSKEIDLIPCQSFSEVFERVEDSNDIFGAVPLENSSMGSIGFSYDLFWLHNTVIVQELFLPVHHTLIAMKGATLSSLEKVYSHPAALEQCRKLFKDNPNLKAIPHWDTAASALLVKQSKDLKSAAIASEKAATEHGLTILKKNIEDYSHNTTRFCLIANSKNGTRETKFPYKVSIAMELPHKPGSLASTLNLFGEAGINLTTIQSRPNSEKAWHLLFFIDMEITSQKQADFLIRLLDQKDHTTKFLGQYPIAKT